MRFLLAVMLALAACGTPGEPIRDWKLVGERDEHVAVTLPSNLMFELPFREHDFTLRATVPISPAKRGRELAIVIPCFHGHVALRANGTSIVDRGDIGGGEHRFILAPELTATPTLAVEVTAHLDNLSAVGFGVTPYLTTEREMRSFVAALNHDGAVLELGLILVFGLLYIAMYTLARRPEDLAFVVLTVFATAAPLWQLGLLHIFGPFAPTIPALAICGAQICVLYFIHHSFELGPPPRWMIRGFAAIGGLTVILGPLSYRLVLASVVAVCLFSLPYMLHVLKVLLRVIRTDTVHRTNATLLLVMMLITGIAVVPDFFGLMIGHNLLGGVHTVSLGIVGCVFTQALLLSRSHVARQHELERNAEELRRQVVERSRELSVALAELARRPVETLGEDRVIADRYRIVKRLGAGGMGTVYEVARTSDNKRLALKTLRGRTDPELMQRFAREAEIAAKLDHPNLVPVLDVGLADGALFLVMPLVEGGSLEQQRAKFGDAAWAKPILAQIAAGLAALHAGGIVHRDLKPGNVLLAPQARIADFGLAGLDATSLTLASGSLGNADTASPAPPLTRAGDIFGTPRYMAPELADGAADAAATVDIFALGVIAYEMLTTHQPFPSPVVMAQLENRQPDPPSMTAVPDEVREIVARCLSFDPTRRPPAVDLATAFRTR